MEPKAYHFINRLSDYLFVLARYCAMCEGKPETTWTKAVSAKQKDTEDKGKEAAGAEEVE